MSRLSNNGFKYGLTISLCDPVVVEMTARAGYSFVRIDWEHMLFDSSTVKDMIRFARLLGISIHVRVSNSANITALLDLGVNGIMIPHVSSKEIAQGYVDFAKYALMGQRGVNGSARALDFGVRSFRDYFEKANEEVKLIVQIEDLEGLNNIDAILSLPGVDMVTTGRSDLSQALGVPGEVTNPKVAEAEDFVIKKAISHKKVPVIKAESQERVAELSKMGVTWFHIGRDEILLNKAIRKCIDITKL